MTSVTATTARKEFFDLVKRALKLREPVRIQHREGDLVMLAEEDYEGLLETLEILSVDGMMESIKEAEQDIAAGRVVDAADLFKDE
ncbi:MAG: type II toxin-antitoxin system Phd/YefM family antitoxin [Thermoanaerobaculales bacterium]|jgi:antitoxin YefM|nr:type II toxin-antitoxin system Phd/YefM family antitoxin [Thermoanaerobaculales bacterium]